MTRTLEQFSHLASAAVRQPRIAVGITGIASIVLVELTALLVLRGLG